MACIRRFRLLFHRMVNSYIWPPACWLGWLSIAVRGFKPWPDHHSGSLNNWRENAALIVTSANGWTSKCPRIRTIKLTPLLKLTVSDDLPWPPYPVLRASGAPRHDSIYVKRVKLKHLLSVGGNALSLYILLIGTKKKNKKKTDITKYETI